MFESSNDRNNVARKHLIWLIENAPDDVDPYLDKLGSTAAGIISQPSAYGETALHIAISRHPDKPGLLVTLLNRLGTQAVSTLQAQNMIGETVFHYAAQLSPRAVPALIKGLGEAAPSALCQRCAAGNAVLDHLRTFHFEWIPQLITALEALPGLSPQTRQACLSLFREMHQQDKRGDGELELVKTAQDFQELAHNDVPGLISAINSWMSRYLSATQQSLLQAEKRLMSELGQADQHGQIPLVIVAFSHPTLLQPVLDVLPSDDARRQAMQQSDANGWTPLHIVARYHQSISDDLIALLQPDLLKALQVSRRHFPSVLHMAMRNRQAMAMLVPLLKGIGQAAAYHVVQMPSYRGKDLLSWVYRACPTKLKDLVGALAQIVESDEDRLWWQALMIHKIMIAEPHASYRSQQLALAILNHVDSQAVLMLVDNYGYSLLHIAAQNLGGQLFVPFIGMLAYQAPKQLQQESDDGETAMDLFGDTFPERYVEQCYQLSHQDAPVSVKCDCLTLLLKAYPDALPFVTFRRQVNALSNAEIEQDLASLLCFYAALKTTAGKNPVFGTRGHIAKPAAARKTLAALALYVRPPTLVLAPGEFAASNKGILAKLKDAFVVKTTCKVVSASAGGVVSGAPAQ